MRGTEETRDLMIMKRKRNEYYNDNENWNEGIYMYIVHAIAIRSSFKYCQMRQKFIFKDLGVWCTVLVLCLLAKASQTPNPKPQTPNPNPKLQPQPPTPKEILALMYMYMCNPFLLLVWNEFLSYCCWNTIEQCQNIPVCSLLFPERGEKYEREQGWWDKEGLSGRGGRVKYTFLPKACNLDKCSLFSVDG